MIEWTKPNGSTITTNDIKATIEQAEKLGWKRVGEEPKKAKRGRPAKEEG